jgi:hypothetical protein
VASISEFNRFSVFYPDHANKDKLPTRQARNEWPAQSISGQQLMSKGG